ncbi:MAG: nitroreductase, partial [Alistipes sp.]|nr:nitroreductase [Alistipes sp.]
LGLNGISILAIDRDKVRQALVLTVEPLLILAIGRGAEKIELTEIGANESHDYYRDESGTHYVPKLRVEELLIV